jgi:hypothetical protein
MGENLSGRSVLPVLLVEHANKPRIERTRLFSTGPHSDLSHFSAVEVSAQIHTVISFRGLIDLHFLFANSLRKNSPPGVLIVRRI